MVSSYFHDAEYIRRIEKYNSEEEEERHIKYGLLGKDIILPDEEGAYTESEITDMLNSIANYDSPGAWNNTLPKLINVINYKGGKCNWVPLINQKSFYRLFDPDYLNSVKDSGYKYAVVVRHTYFMHDETITGAIYNELYEKELEVDTVLQKCICDFNNDLTFVFSTIPINYGVRQILIPIQDMIKDAEEFQIAIAKDKELEGQIAMSEVDGNYIEEPIIYDKPDNYKSGLHPDVIKAMKKAGFSDNEISDKYNNRQVISIKKSR